MRGFQKFELQNLRMAKLGTCALKGVALVEVT
jgi:hypothetical protein